MFELQLTKGRVALIDVEDADLAAMRWHVTNGYPARAVWRGGRRTIYLHQVIARRMGIVGLTDHIDRDRLNATRANLRATTYSQNNGNVAARGKTGLLGVYLYRRAKWSAEFRRDGIRRRKAGFTSPEAAAVWRAEQFALAGTY